MLILMFLKNPNELIFLLKYRMFGLKNIYFIVLVQFFLTKFLLGDSMPGKICLNKERENNHDKIHIF